MPKISALPPMTTAAADDEQPIVDDSAGTTKKWTLTLLKTYLQSLVGWLTTAMIADDAVTAAKIDWASTGANGGIWWEELGRTTLGASADVITLSGLPTRKYLRIIYSTLNSGAVTVGVKFNNDGGANYSYRYLADVVGGTSINATSILSTGGNTGHNTGFIDVVNIANYPKSGHESSQFADTNAGGNVTQVEYWFKWTNNSAAISRVDITNGGAGDFLSGSQVIVLGHD